MSEPQPDFDDRVSTLFSEVQKISGVAERQAYLKQVCGDNQSLIEEVESLLQFDWGDEAEPVDDFVDKSIGKYDIKAEIGRGGMGTVYLGRRTEGYKQDVAIKIINRAMLSPEGKRRFAKEMQIMSRLKHNNLATLYNAGRTENGLPYVVMEYIDGKHIDSYCDEKQLSIRERLELFREVCSVVAYAHENKVIHRDIKPSNILVTPRGEPKLIDFGIAKVVRSQHDAATYDFTTLVQNRAFSADYASPEQVRGEKTIGTTTDVYSLGVVLYELLTGYQAHRFKRYDAEEIRRVVCESEITKPSLVIETGKNGDTKSEVTSESVSEARSCLPKELHRFLKGDLDAVLMKALSKDSDERYQGVEEFSEDIDNYLQGRPVKARKGALGKQVTSFARKVADNLPPISFPYKPKLAAYFVLLLLGAISLGVLYSRNTGRAASSGPIDSVAVLPFVTEGSDSETRSFNEGLTDNLIVDLTAFRKLRVTSRSVVIDYRDKSVDLRQIGKDLNVRAVVTGRARRVGDAIIIHAELTDVEKMAQIWSKDFPPVKVSNKMSSEEGTLSSNICKELLSNLSEKYFRTYESFLNGRRALEKRTIPTLKQGIVFFQDAIDTDPNYAPAFAGMADCYNLLVVYGGAKPRDGFPQARAAALKALAIDDSMAEAHTSLAFSKFRWDRDRVEADREFKQAITQKPNYASAHQWYSSFLVAVGHFDEAIGEATLAEKLDPSSSAASAHLAWIYYFAGQSDRAIEHCSKLLAALDADEKKVPARRYRGLAYEEKGMYPEAIDDFKNASKNSPLILALLGHAYAVSGQKAKAHEVLNQLTALEKDLYVSPYTVAAIYVGLDDTDEAFKQLEKAYDEKDVWLMNLKVDPVFAKLRSDKRFTDLIARARLDS